MTRRAEDALGRAISLWKEVRSARGEASATALLGWVQNDTTITPGAEELAVGALALLDVARRARRVDSSKCASVARRLVPTVRGRYDEAVLSTRQALDAAQEAGLRSGGRGDGLGSSDSSSASGATTRTPNDSSFSRCSSRAS